MKVFTDRERDQMLNDLAVWLKLAGPQLVLEPTPGMPRFIIPAKRGSSSHFAGKQAHSICGYWCPFAV